MRLHTVPKMLGSPSFEFRNKRQLQRLDGATYPPSCSSDCNRSQPPFGAPQSWVRPHPKSTLDPMATPPEITRPPFIFRDAFFVDLGPGKRHARAADSELRALLLPGAKAAPPKDQVAHYYEAQLLHYGLARTKDKNLAKVRLTKALSEAGKGGLQAPVDVKRLEEEMKKEWTKEVRKAAKADKVVVAAPAAAGGKKRKAAEAEMDQVTATTTGFKARVTVDIDVPGVGAPRAKATPKKAKTEATTAKKAPSAKKPNGEASSPKGGTASTTAKKTKAEGTAARGASGTTRGGKKATKPGRSITASGPASTAESSKPRPKQTAKRSAPFMANNPSYRPQPYSPSPDRMDLDDPDDAPPAYDSHGFDTYDSPPPTRQEKRPSVQITGHYDMDIDVENSE